MSAERINEKALVQSLILGDKEAKRQLLSHFRDGNVFFNHQVQKILADAIVGDSKCSDDAEDVLSIYCHDHYLVSERCICPEALEVLIVSLKEGSKRAQVFLCEYMREHSFDDASLLLLIDSLKYPLVKAVFKSYIEDTQRTEKFDQKGHTIFDASRQRLINLVQIGDPVAWELYLNYAYAQEEKRSFNREEMQCIDFMNMGYLGFKEVLMKSYSSQEGKLKLLELMRRGSNDAYDVLRAQGIASFGDETESLTIDLLAEGCKGANELLLQYIVNHHLCEANLKKLQRLAARGSKNAQEILNKYKS